MQITINSTDTAPIAEQIRDQVVRSMAAFELRSGDLLTPAGELAEQLVASPSAVHKAYRALESEGLCRWSARGFEVAPATLEELRERARKQRWMGSRQALLDDLELARKIQVRLMPPSFIEAGGYAVAAKVHAAEFVSGDFYDVLPRGGGVVDVVVADVSGKGVGASLIMASVKARLPLLPAALPVAELLRRLNEQLHLDLGQRQFVALACARFFSDSGRLEVANAGLPPPYVIREGEVPVPVSVPGPSLPLGARPKVDYAAAEITLEPGNRLLIFSDGIPEAPTTRQEPLGYEALATLVEDYAGETWGATHRAPAALDAWLDGFLTRVTDAAEGVPTDDQTVLVLERRGS